MTHNSEDELLGYALEVITSDEERDKIAAHIRECSECRLRLEKIEKDIEVISGVKPILRSLSVPGSLEAAARPHPRSPLEAVTYTILRTAALVLVGILVGFGASKRIHREPDFVSPAYITVSPPTDSLTPYSVSDATRVSPRYYERLLEGRK